MLSCDITTRGYFAAAPATLGTSGIRKAIGRLVRSVAVPFDATRVILPVSITAEARARDIATSGMYGGTSTIVSTGGYRIPQHHVFASLNASFSAVKNIYSDHILQFENPAASGLIISDITAQYAATLKLTRALMSPFSARQAISVGAGAHYDTVARIMADASHLYSSDRRISADKSIQVESAGIWGATVFMHATAQVHFITPPLISPPTKIALRQVAGRDTNGDLCVYVKSNKTPVTHTLAFKINKSILDSLLTFQAAVDGRKRLFTWYDHANAAHTVRFDQDINYLPIGTDNYRVTIVLREELAR